MTFFHWAKFFAAAIAFGFSAHKLYGLVGWDSPWLGLVLMGCFMGLAAIGEPLFTLRVPGRIRLVREWEVAGRAYHRLGVPLFGQFLRNTPLRLLNPSVYIKGVTGDLARLRRQVESAEAIHFWGFAILMPYVGLAMIDGEIARACVLVLVQMLLHIYPIMNLRMLRGRLDQILARSHRKAQSRHPTGH